MSVHTNIDDRVLQPCPPNHDTHADFRRTGLMQPAQSVKNKAPGWMPRTWRVPFYRATVLGELLSYKNGRSLSGKRPLSGDTHLVQLQGCVDNNSRIGG
jgi:hypothetical protein